MWRLVSGVFALLVGAWLGHQRSDVARVTFCDVGQGDATLIAYGGRNFLFDVGPSADRVQACLDRQRVRSLDGVFLSHPDLDHVGAVPAIAKAFPNVKFFLPNHFRESQAFADQVNEWNLTDRFRWIEAKSVLRVGSSTLSLTPPVWRDGEPDNSGSLLLRFCLKGSCFLGTGDLDETGEEILLGDGNWEASLAKAGHHGSQDSTGKKFLEAVKPRHVVISAGRQNRFGHPHPATLQRLSAAGAKVYRTDQLGSIRFESVTGGWKLDVN